MDIKSSEFTEKIKIVVIDKDNINGKFGFNSDKQFKLIKEVYAKFMYQRYYDKVKTVGTFLEKTITVIIRYDMDLVAIDTSYKIDYKDRQYNIVDITPSFDKKYITMIVKDSVVNG